MCCFHMSACAMRARLAGVSRLMISIACYFKLIPRGPILVVHGIYVAFIQAGAPVCSGA